MAFVAIHIGAGYHSPQDEDAFRSTLEGIISKLRVSLEGREESTALDLVHEALVLLENNDQTNAGLGSCLTMDGYVEMDALMVDGASGAIGAVGAVSDVRNPSSIAWALIRDQQEASTTPILVPSLMLCGHGARAYAEEKGLEVFPISIPFHSPLTTPKVIQRYKELKDRYDRQQSHGHTTTPLSQCKDTVGVICLDLAGNVAAGVSTGGRWLKPRGRVGDSAIYGAGAHVSQSGKGNDHFRFASATTGTGEYLIQTMFARSQCEAIQRDKVDTSTAIKAHLRMACETIRATEKGLGFISLVEVEEPGMLEFWIGHTTHSLGYAYYASSSRRSHCEISRKQNGAPHKLQCISIKYR